METEQVPAFTLTDDWSGQLVATAVHAGHELRPETKDLMILDEATRLREEDPYTDLIGSAAPAQIVARRSRFEVDLNRPRREAVYRRPEDCWGLEVWRTNPLPDDVFQRSLQIYDDFYAALAEKLDEVAERGPFVVYDVHSYNHRREGESAMPEPIRDNPEVNLGTGSVDMERFGGVVEAFTSSLRAQSSDGRPVDVRENVKFEGRGLAWWIHDRYPGVGCCLALEFKKTFMDEWTGEADHGRIMAKRDALATTHEPVLEALKRVQ